MKIAIAPFSSPFVDFFINLANYLEASGNEVHFLEPDKYTRRLLLKSKLKIVFYPYSKEPTNYYSREHNLIRYYKRLLNISNTNKLINRKNSEYSCALKFFKHNAAYDKVIFWNGEGNVETQICEDIGMDAMFLENGYFPGTLQFNYGGVNCNASYSNLEFENFCKYSIKEIDSGKIDLLIVSVKQNIFSRYILRAGDKKYNYLFKNIIKSNRARANARKRFSALPVDNIDLKSFGKYIFFPLQVNSDTQIVLNSPFDSMYEVLETILPKIKNKGFKILIKEHPAEVENVDYSRFIDNDETFLIKKFPINKLIEGADFTICVNSSVGLQAIEAQSKVVVLGESLYSSAPNVILWTESTDIIKSSSEISINAQQVKAYTSHLRNKIFIKGRWQVPDLELLRSISNRIQA